MIFNYGTLFNRIFCTINFTLILVYCIKKHFIQHSAVPILFFRQHYKKNLKTLYPRCIVTEREDYHGSVPRSEIKSTTHDGQTASLTLKKKEARVVFEGKCFLKKIDKFVERYSELRNE